MYDEDFGVPVIELSIWLIKKCGCKTVMRVKIAIFWLVGMLRWLFICGALNYQALRMCRVG
jgi:hypothetical protein